MGACTSFPAALNSRIIEFQGAKAIISGVVDLSQQKSAEAEIARQREALAESEQRFRTIAEAHPLPMYIARRSDRRVIHANQRFADLMRVPLESIADTPHSRFYPDPAERERFTLALRRDRVVQDFETTIRRDDGSMFPAAVTAQLIDYQGEEAAVFGVVDLT